jgi:hypothetical protein
MEIEPTRAPTALELYQDTLDQLIAERAGGTRIAGTVAEAITRTIEHEAEAMREYLEAAEARYRLLRLDDAVRRIVHAANEERANLARLPRSSANGRPLSCRPPKPERRNSSARTF